MYLRKNILRRVRERWRLQVHLTQSELQTAGSTSGRTRPSAVHPVLGEPADGTFYQRELQTTGSTTGFRFLDKKCFFCVVKFIPIVVTTMTS